VIAAIARATAVDDQGETATPDVDEGDDRAPPDTSSECRLRSRSRQAGRW
jgi:hypothetical protein